MNKITCMLAGASLLAIAGGVSAEPVTLSAAQMDNVSAGSTTLYAGLALSASGALAVSKVASFTGATTFVDADPNHPLVPHATASGTSGGIAISNYNPLSPNNGAFVASGVAVSAAVF